MASDFERLAYEAALRTLDKQEEVLRELRARTGVLLAASSLGGSFLGQRAFEGSPALWLVVVAVVAFLTSIGASVYVLVPKRDQFVFSLSGPDLYTGLYEFRDDLAETYRRLAYDLDRFWESNDGTMQRLFWGYRVAAVGLVVELIALVGLLSGTLI